MFMKLRETKGFTLIEIMIVVAIIGLLVAIAVPNYLRTKAAAGTASCESTERIIQDAVYGYYTETDPTPTGGPSDTGAGTWLNYIRGGVKPTCPSSAGTYTVGGATYDACTVTCSVHDAA